MTKELTLEEDVSRVKESVARDLRKEYRLYPNVTVEQAVHEVLQDFDVALAGTSDAHQKQRVEVMRHALLGIGINVNYSENKGFIIEDARLLREYLKTVA